MARMKKPPEAARGSYGALTHALLDAAAYIGASTTAKALLIELLRQHDGRNNGRLHLAHSWLSGRGWPSKSTVEKARDELLARGLIVQTRTGGMNIGPAWFALSWLAVSNFTGLDIGPAQYHPGAWMLCQLPPTERRKPPTKKREASPDHRGSTDPTTGAASQSTDPTTGDNEYNHYPPVGIHAIGPADRWAKFRTARRRRFTFTAHKWSANAA